MLRIEVLGIDLQPLCSTPCGEVYTISHIAYMVLLRIIATPDGSEHLLRYPAVKHRHTIHLLTGVTSEGRHTELLALIIRIGTSHANELIP